MAEHTHDHEHDHGPQGGCSSCGHAHGHGHAPDPLNDLDQANQSLADALRVSFRLLTLIMVLVVIAFLMTGIKTIAPNQVGIKKVFGRQVAEVTQAGLTYNWPYPIGEIELVGTEKQMLAIDDFWMYESETDKLEPELTKRSASGSSLRPGWDGVLLTGDRSMIHARLSCMYTVRRAALARSRVEDIPGAVRSAVCNAAIRTAAQWSADQISSRRDEFAAQVAKLAQTELDELMGLGAQAGSSAVGIDQVTVIRADWSIQVQASLLAAQTARTNMEKTLQTARADATNTLNAVMDRKYIQQLVGDVLGERKGGPAAATRPAPDAPADPLVQRYDEALRAGHRTQADTLLASIDEILTRPDVGGQVSTIINTANSQASQTVQRVNARAERFNRLLADYKADPEFMLQRLWAAAREEILRNPTVEKHYLTMDAERLVIHLSRDPRIVKSIENELLKQQADAAKGR